MRKQYYWPLGTLRFESIFSKFMTIVLNYLVPQLHTDNMKSLWLGTLFSSPLIRPLSNTEQDWQFPSFWNTLFTLMTVLSNFSPTSQSSNSLCALLHPTWMLWGLSPRSSSLPATCFLIAFNKPLYADKGWIYLQAGSLLWNSEW